MANTKVTGDLIAGLTIATGNIADDAVTSDKISGITTAHIAEGSNLYYTNARADARITAATTSDLTEGTNLYYTDARADARAALLVDSAPSTLDTLNELAAALGDDPNFATTTATSIGTKLPLAGGTLTGTLIITGGTAYGLNITTSGTQDTIKIDRAATNDNAITKYQTASADKWIVGLRNTADDNFRFYSYGTATDVLTINQADGNVTFDRNIIGNSGNTTEIGTYPTGGVKRIRMVQGGELHFGDTTTSNFLGLTEGAVNDFGDQDRLGLYCRNELKIYGNSNLLKVTIPTSGNSTFAEGATFGGDVKTTGAAIGTTQADGDYLSKLYTLNADGFMSLYTGQATPLEKVRITSYGNNWINPANNGNFGIGTADPDHKLEVVGGLALRNSNSRLYFGTNNGTDRRALEGDVNGTVLQIGEGYATNRIYGDIQMAKANPSIHSTTADGSDNSSLQLSGGGAFGDARGASIALAGNENGNGGLMQLRAGQGTYSQIRMYTSGAERVRLTSGGNLEPAADAAQNLGTTAKRWANLYTTDLHLSNKGKTNDVDNTWGNWTIQEGEEDLFLINNRSGKKYKFLLQKVD